MSKNRPYQWFNGISAQSLGPLLSQAFRSIRIFGFPPISGKSCMSTNVKKWGRHQDLHAFFFHLPDQLAAAPAYLDKQPKLHRQDVMRLQQASILVENPCRRYYLKRLRNQLKLLAMDSWKASHVTNHNWIAHFRINLESASIAPNEMAAHQTTKFQLKHFECPLELDKSK